MIQSVRHFLKVLEANVFYILHDGDFVLMLAGFNCAFKI